MILGLVATVVLGAKGGDQFLLDLCGWTDQR
jgi:hypothetical protein